MLLFLSHFAGGSVWSHALLALVIILCTIVLEDLTTVIVGVLAADGVIGVPFALLSLYAGVVLGDAGLYGLGRLASTHPRLVRFIEHEYTALFRTWLETRFVLTVFSARFIPGSRLPTYTASGFFRSPFSTFIATIGIAMSIWTTMLFAASYWFGSLTSGWLEHVRWGIAGAFLVFLFLVGRHNLRAYRAEKSVPTPPESPG
jgi:membrane protein DedA with SNARE-associated domain